MKQRCCYSKLFVYLTELANIEYRISNISGEVVTTSPHNLGGCVTQDRPVSVKNKLNAGVAAAMPNQE